MPERAFEHREACLDRLHRGLSVRQLTLAADQQAALIDYIALLTRWNRVYNLTSVRDPLAMINKHLLDSLSVLGWLPDSSERRGDQIDVLDIGSGAGLPGIPLALVRQDLQFQSVESNGKKARFQQQALIELGLNNVSVIEQRIESVRVEARCVVSRAFTAPSRFLEIASAHTQRGDQAIVMLGDRTRLPAEAPSDWSLVMTRSSVPDDSDAPHVALFQRLATNARDSAGR